MKKVLWSFVFVLSFFIFPFTNASAASNEQQLVKEIKEIITENYVGTINGNLQKAKTIDEIIDMLDPYSTYFTQQEFEEFMNSINLSTIGIGVVIEEHEDGIHILQVIENSGAFDGGVVAGDIIIAINGETIVGRSTQETSSLLIGDEGTQVTLTLQHENGTTSTKAITRKKFTLPNVQSELLFGNVGYISMSSFSEDGAQLVKKELIQLQQRGATSFIFDLQNNGGGYVATMEELAGLFPNAKIAYLLEEAHASYKVRVISQDVKFPLDTRILVNRYSASASEMLSASLQDQHSAILYGETTYGKGAMQGFYELRDGSYLKLTVGKFTGPSGHTIHEVGVKPNIETKTPPIFQAHYDALKTQYTNYKELTSLKNVSDPKKLTVKIPFALPSQLSEDKVQLIALGANEVPITAKVDGRSLIVTPSKPLSPGQEYMLLVHPKTQKANKVQKGFYLHITMKN
ncbi:PDZ domain-containing protein [Lysinibacillus agricola]|uniref:PDZ domain-containing protein n=1 Tax=Lysinibacillus agricola TaxID=2590012 RepID=A0ABX7ATB9_9BACI|nr:MULTISPECIES: S41 family peptidase [Lysinibacillus]KOS60761.1 peptidase S41 [Lysinibacillus sp. FJAT-14222]QQP13216.1 PDZ domain-containing protein [Lysinibacillus agricola]